MLDESAASQRNLCFDCGLCCDGALYTHVELGTSDDKDTLSILGLRSGQDKNHFNQPCPAYRSKRCSIYPSRPENCRKYRCALLRAHDSGEVTYEEGRKLIDDTIQLRDRVRGQVEDFINQPGPHSISRLLQMTSEKIRKMDSVQLKQVDPGMLLDVGTLRVVLSKRFEPDDKG